MMSKEASHKFLLGNSSTLIILVGSFIWSMVMVRSGLVYATGMAFWGPNAHDGLWHVALANAFAQNSLQMPVYAGELLKNYHIGFDVLLAFIHKITTIPIYTLYFQVLPPVIALCVGFATRFLIRTWKRNDTYAFWVLFLVYFGGSFGWLVSLVRDRTWGGESMFWAQQALSTLINPPFALSLVLVGIGLAWFIRYFRKASWKDYVLAIVALSLLSVVKVYASILIIGALTVTSLYEYVTKKTTKSFSVLVPTIFLSLAFFLPLNKGSSSLIEIKPFWFLETMMLFVDRLNWPNFYWAFETYKQNGNYPKLALAYLVALIIFWYGNLSTRLMAEFYVAKRIISKELDYVDVFLCSVILAGFAIPLFVLQKGTPWNTIQFTYYALFSAAILAGVAFAEIIQKFKSKKTVLTCLLLVLTLPTTISTLSNYIDEPSAIISKAELAALQVLANSPKGVVLTQLHEDLVNLSYKPVFAHESTAYISALSGRQTFLADEVNLTITDYDFASRKTLVKMFFEKPNSESGREVLHTMGVDYIYKLKDQQMGLDENTLNIENIFDNEEVIIYKLRK